MSPDGYLGRARIKSRDGRLITYVFHKGRRLEISVAQLNHTIKKGRSPDILMRRSKDKIRVENKNQNNRPEAVFDL
jgi:hypothetical protein